MINYLTDSGSIVIASGLFAGAANADILINIDLSTVNQVTFTATAGVSAATVSGSTGTGMYFDNLYVAGISFNATTIASNLTSAENPSIGEPRIYRAGGLDHGLNLYNWTSGADASFTEGALAFTGSASYTLTATEYADMLGGNTSGNMYFPADKVGDVPSATLIGEYQVIPEPATLSLVAVLGGTVLFVRRKFMI